MTTATCPPANGVGDLGVMSVVGTSAVIGTHVGENSFVERGKSIVNARRAFGGGDGGAKAAARTAAASSARDTTDALARAQRALGSGYKPGSSTPDGTGKASNSQSPLTSPKKVGKDLWAEASPSREVTGGRSSNEHPKPDTPTTPTRRKSTPPSSPKRSTTPRSTLKSPIKSPTKPKKASDVVESPTDNTVLSPEAAARVRVAAAAAAAAASAEVDPDPESSAAAREAKANAAAAAAAARVRKSREFTFGSSPNAYTPSLAASAALILEETRAKREHVSAEAARRVRLAREQEEASRAKRRLAESEKQNRGRASREAATRAKERRRRELYALNTLLAASERAASLAGSKSATAGPGQALPNHLRV